MRVLVSTLARNDIKRLNTFLETRSPPAAARAIAVLQKAVSSLSTMSHRGFNGPRSGERQLFIAFGRAGYIVQYVVEPHMVVVLRIFHTLEDR